MPDWCDLLDPCAVSIVPLAGAGHPVSKGLSQAVPERFTDSGGLPVQLFREELAMNLLT